MKLDIRALTADEQRTLDIDYEMPLTGGDIPLPPPEDMILASLAHVKGSIVNVAGCLHADVTVSVAYTAACARCLTEVKGMHTFSFERHIVPAGQFAGLDEDVSDEYLPVEDGMLDMDEAIGEALVLSLPLRILCREDCAGLCHKCGKNLNAGACDCAEGEIDPRMAPLQALLEKMRAEEQGNGKDE